MNQWRWMLGILLCTCVHASAADGLISNGAMEDAKPGALPPHWEALNVGVPAEFAADTTDKHSGQASVKINANEDARSYVRSSDPIPVAPGEEIRASAWVKAQNVPADHGTVIMIAEFTNAEGDNLTVAKFDVADLKKQGEWQQIGGSVKVPPQAAQLRLRLGFSYAKGTCWWDEVSVHAAKPLVCRIDLPGSRLSPAMKTLPVVILNRDGRKGAATLRMTLNKKSADTAVQLSGKPVQEVELPLKVAKPGKAEVSVALVQNGAEIFSDERKATIPPPLTLSPPSPTHWCVEDGAPKVEAWVDVAVADELREEASLDVRITDGGGKVVGTAKVPSVKNGVTHVDIQAKQLPEGDYTLIAELKPRSGEPIKVEQAWHVIPRRLAKVTLNAAGYPEYDSKAIFPLGIFNGGKFKEQAEAGFTVTHAYNAVRLEEDREHADMNALRYVENTQANGMKMLFMVPMKAAIANDWDAIRRRVRMFRNHPGLLAWDEEEGFARGDFKGDTLKKLRQIVAEEDPNHPFMVGDAHDVITRMKKDRSDLFPADQMDMGMWWWYPLPFKSAATQGNALEGDEGPAGNEMAPPSFLVHATTKKPIWVGIQSYKKKDQRYPTPIEYRSQAYIALIHGAKGLMWYGGSVTGGLFLAPEEGHWDDLKKLARELNDQQDVFMSPNAPAPKITPENAPVSVCVKNLPRETVLLIANRASKPVDVTVAGWEKLHLDPLEVKVVHSANH